MFFLNNKINAASNPDNGSFSISEPDGGGD
jgi:hypothetical protein